MNTKIKNSSISNNNYRFLKPVDIIPKDDTYHGNIRFLDIEWWYFDAVFDNGYSIQIGFRIYHIRRFGIVQSRINIYKNGKIIAEKLKINLFSNFFINPDFPIINIYDNTVVKFDDKNYNKNKKWKYRLKLSINDIEVDLNFTGTTRGWKIETPDTCWVVPLPKANVEGKINLNGKLMWVKGVGYHDHNWSYSPTTAMNNLGWYWGRISTDTMNITWAKVIHSSNNIDFLAVLNKDGGTFYNIGPKNIQFSIKNYGKISNGKIPKTFDLKIDDKTTGNFSIYCQFRLSTFDVHYNRIFTIKYWRYHVKTNGTLSINNFNENIKDKPQIIEFLKFKAKNVV